MHAIASFFKKYSAQRNSQQDGKKSFAERLKNIHYEGPLPSYATDPITFNLMENPLILNQCENHTLDETTLIQCESTREKINPFTNDAITSRRKNHARHKQINDFISSLEELHRLEQLYRDGAANISTLEGVLNAEENLSHEEIANTLSKEKKELLIPVQLAQLDVLSTFIQETEKNIRQADGDATEVEEILRNYQTMRHQLQSVIAALFPDVQPAQSLNQGILSLFNRSNKSLLQIKTMSLFASLEVLKNESVDAATVLTHSQSKFGGVD